MPAAITPLEPQGDWGFGDDPGDSEEADMSTKRVTPAGGAGMAKETILTTTAARVERLSTHDVEGGVPPESHGDDGNGHLRSPSEKFEEHFFPENGTNGYSVSNRNAISKPDEVKLAFKNYTVALKGNALVKDAIGYVRKGGLTAVLGPSASGKSVLLKTLAGHTRDLIGGTVSGSVLVDGAPMKSSGVVALQPQGNEHLIGVLTVRESIMYSLKLKKPRMPQDEREKRVDEVLEKLGLEVCKDTQIGTIYKRGISGGQQRRVAIGVEIVYAPDILCLDEPTSGLDTTTAINTVQYLRTLLAESNGRAGYLMTIHQPNAELLSLFDDVILMVNGGTVYSGTVDGAVTHFNQLENRDVRLAGVPPTETHLRLADTTFAAVEAGDVPKNYPAQWQNSTAYADLSDLLVPYTSKQVYQVPSRSLGDHLSQFQSLFWRLTQVARRDLTLFHVQYFLQGQYGFMIGAIFFQRKHEIGTPVVDMTSALLWLAALSIYVFVFKSYYNATQYPVLTHERQNSMYGVVANALSELSVLLLAIPGYIPATLIGFFMIGFPASSLPFMILFIFVASFTSEALPGFVANFTRNDPSKALMVTQGLLLIFFIFAGGAFIREDDIPSYWRWLQAISPFEHGVKAVIMACFENMELQCPAPGITNGEASGYQTGVITDGFGSCVTLEATYPCDALDTGAPDGCKVHGETTIRILNQYDTDKYESLLYLFIIGVVYRLVNMLFQMYPPDVFMNLISSIRSVGANRSVVSASVVDWFATGANVTGPKKMIRQNSSSQSHTPILTFRDIQVRIAKKLLVKPKTILNDVSGLVTGGRLCALMGPSGSGKTTLLNALSGRALYAEVDGVITLDGHKLTKQHFAYVPQIDALNPVFTVKETLVYAVRLRCTDTWAKLEERVQELMEIVGLVAVQDVRCGKLTGGQLKLLSVAVGLVQRPTVLYLDEPTTGLDSTAASVVMEYLSAIAKTGVVTLLTVHQPSKSVFDLVDDIILLSSDGSLAFSGPTDQAIDFFKSAPFFVDFPDNENPADTLIEAVSSKTRDSQDFGGRSNGADGAIMMNVVKSAPLRQISDAYAESAVSKRLSEQLIKSENNPREPVVIPNPGFTTRLTVLVDKTLRLYWREPGAYMYMSIVVVFFAAFVGTLFYDLDHTTEGLREVRAAMFISIWMALYFTLISIPVNCQERDEAVRMVASNHCTQVEWVLAQFIAQMPYSFTLTVVLTALFHYLTDINDSTEVFFWMILNLWLLHMLFASVSWNIIETLVNPMLATTAAMAVLGTFFLFAGFFILVDDLVPVVRWIPYTVATFYSLTGTQYAYMHGVDFIDRMPNGTEFIVTGDSILETQLEIHYDSPDRYWFDLLIIFAFLLAFKMQHAFFFWKHTKDLGVTTRKPHAAWEKDCCRDVCGC
eukprot:m.79660 g.79660  ORF g.79660 m.79660 type:complete len:1404 (+) comp9307_c0_seq1:41-4252(+)